MVLPKIINNYIIKNIIINSSILFVFNSFIDFVLMGRLYLAYLICNILATTLVVILLPKRKEYENEMLKEEVYTNYVKANAIQKEIQIRANEIKVVEDKLSELEKLQTEITEYLNLEHFLGETLWKELCAFRREDSFENNNYISDGLDNTKLLEKAQELLEKAKAEGIALFTYPTTGYFDAFTYALLASAGGTDFYNSCMTYEDGIWESENATKVFELIAKLGEYTEATTVANANNDNFTKNQQLILDNKAIFCPNGTWLPGEMAEAPRADGFEWGFMALPAVNAGGSGCSFCWFEQMWIPAAAENQDMAKEFVAYMYSDEAAKIFAKSTAIQPITGVSDSLEGDNKMFYSIYDNGATAVMGGFASTEPVEGVNMLDTLCGTVNSIVSGDKTVAEWQTAVEEASDKLRAAMN